MVNWRSHGHIQLILANSYKPIPPRVLYTFPDYWVTARTLNRRPWLSKRVPFNVIALLSTTSIAIHHIWCDWYSISTQCSFTTNMQKKLSRKPILKPTNPWILYTKNWHFELTILIFQNLKMKTRHNSPFFGLLLTNSWVLVCS